MMKAARELSLNRMMKTSEYTEKAVSTKTIESPSVSIKRITIWLGLWGGLIFFIGLLFAVKWILIPLFNWSIIAVGLALLGASVGIYWHRTNPVLQKYLPLFRSALFIFEGPLLILLVIIITFGVVEGMTRLIAARASNAQMVNSGRSSDYDRLALPAYQNVPYATEAFIEEIIGFRSGTISGQYINTVDDLRITAFQPANYKYRVWVFGGSTIFCLDVPDQYTIPSYLQLTFLSAYGEKYRVENYGYPAFALSEQVDLLKATDIQAGDIVIFYDGYNEIRNNLRLETKKLTSFLEHSLFYRSFIMPIINRGLPGSFTRTAQQAYDNYMRYIPEAYAYVAEHDAVFLHILQPSIYTIDEPNTYEKNFLQDYNLHYRGWNDLFIKGYARLQDANNELEKMGIPSYDLTGVLNQHDEKVPGEIFIDDIHLNHYGNQLIAQEIFVLIQNYLNQGNQAAVGVLYEKQ